MFTRDLLALANEAPLQPLPEQVFETYRLTINSAWGNHRIIRAYRRHNEDRDNEEYKGITFPEFKYFLVAHWLHFRELRHSAELRLHDIQWACLKALLRAGQFWELPESGGNFGLDGADWTLEGSEQERYHQVRRWSPDPETDGEWLRLPCQYLLDLAEIAAYEHAEFLVRPPEALVAGEALRRGVAGDSRVVR
jgi:hypothetical protein